MVISNIKTSNMYSTLKTTYHQETNSITYLVKHSKTFKEAPVEVIAKIKIYTNLCPE